MVWFDYFEEMTCGFPADVLSPNTQFKGIHKVRFDQYICFGGITISMIWFFF